MLRSLQSESTAGLNRLSFRSDFSGVPPSDFDDFCNNTSLAVSYFCSGARQTGSLVSIEFWINPLRRGGDLTLRFTDETVG